MVIREKTLLMSKKKLKHSLFFSLHIKYSFNYGNRCLLKDDPNLRIIPIEHLCAMKSLKCSMEEWVTK